MNHAPFYLKHLFLMYRKDLKALLRKAERVELKTTSPRPTREQGDGDIIVGILPNELMKLWIAIHEFHEHAIHSRNVIDRQRYRLFCQLFGEAIIKIQPKMASRINTGEYSIQVTKDWMIVLVPATKPVYIEIYGF